MIIWLIALLLSLDSWCANESYSIENISLPKGIDPQIGAMAFMPDGRLIVSFNYGKVFTYNTETKQWKLFAEGLHLPLGILPINNREVLVMQRPELTKLIDRDGDGDADVFEKVYDGFGLSGNYHEFGFGPVKDKAGNLFIGLNVASNNGGITPEVRGEFKSFGISQNELAGRFDKKRVSRMYSCVPYRGWIMKISPDGEVTPYASGVRSPNGLGFDHKGRLLVSDNQGDWLGTSKLHHIEEGKFYGHPASLVWDPLVKGDPMKIPVGELNKMRTPAAGLFAHGLIANSPTQPLLDNTAGKFGPFANQMIIGEMNLPHLVRFIPDEVDGVLQGTLVPFLKKTSLGKGNNRLVFGPDGSLWAGKMHLVWAGGEGLKRIKWTGKSSFEVKDVKLTKTGFDLTFTEALNEELVKQLNNTKITSYSYSYHAKYGSKKMGKRDILVKSVRLSQDNKTLSLSVNDLTPGRVYEFNLGNLKNNQNKSLQSALFCYNLIKTIK